MCIPSTYHGSRMDVHGDTVISWKSTVNGVITGSSTSYARTVEIEYAHDTTVRLPWGFR